MNFMDQLSLKRTPICESILLWICTLSPEKGCKPRVLPGCEQAKRAFLWPAFTAAHDSKIARVKFLFTKNFVQAIIKFIFSLYTFMTTLCCPKQAVYRPRRPEQTPLFQLVKKHYTTWHKNKARENEVPRYISNAFQKYLGCGILAKGFACAHCEGCNKDFFIAFSCKARGVCPSCNQRAMVESASHLVESVLPRLPFRQFVMSFPRRIRCYLENHKTLQAVLKIVVDEIRKRLITCSHSVKDPQIGAISFIQHFGNTLNYHPHSLWQHSKLSSALSLNRR